MNRFLLVGCGGSGGVTLQYLMDQLRADLQALGVADLPRGWQFVHIDVPLDPDGGGTGRPPVVSDQGGYYVRLSYQGASYQTIYRHVADTLRQTENGVSHLAPWVPDDECRVPVESGAGQYRAVGRTLTLPQQQEITETLAAAYHRMAAAGADAELNEIANRAAPGAGSAVSPVTITLVVSSMAGGAGASMVLDVCRLLSGVASGIAGHTALFLYTPEVFGSLEASTRQGVDANAMAMMGELLAAQLGAGSASDHAVLKALGWNPSSIDPVPFRRVFPIGARIGGDGAQFGDGSLDGIYRATARGLAGLMLSEKALGSFVKYDLANDIQQGTNLEWLGWGAPADRVQWGSFGFASLGLGRERYQEYAAQRLARIAVDRLVRGHVSDSDPRTDNEQLAQRTEFRWQQFRSEVLLPTGGGEHEVAAWVSQVVPSGAVRATMRAAFDEILGHDLAFQGGIAVSQFAQMWPARLASRQHEVQDAVAREAYRLVYAWHEALRDRVENALVQEAASSGLPTARELLKRAGAEIPTWIAVLRTMAQHRAVNTAVPEERSWHTVMAQSGGKQQVHAGHPMLLDVGNGQADVLARAVLARAMHLLADVLVSAREDFLGPLSTTVDQSLAELETARRAQASDTGLARVSSDQYAAWPSGIGEVPRRFAAAHNEVLLTPATQFEATFQSHIVGTGARPAGDAIADAVVGILSGRWESAGAMQRPLPVVVRRAAWRPGSLPRIPGNVNAPSLPPQRADYALHFRPRDVRERALRWLQRPGEAFSRFVTQSLFTYLTEAGVGADELAQRAATVREKFLSTLALARPLVAVNTAAFQTIHGGSLQELYKFSAVPFRGLPIADQLADDLGKRGATISRVSVQAFEEAVVDGHESRAARIDLFGSYQPTSPLVFTSLLAPIASRWAGAIQPAARDEFWKWRRARRLPGALPVSDPARKAMVGGFFVGRLTGLVRLPGESFGAAAEIWDLAQGEWLRFPEPLLTPRSRHQDPLDLLPALLESILIAVAQCHAGAALAPLTPYRLLRELYDDNPNKPYEGHQVTARAAVRHLGHWVTEGRSPSGTLPDPARSGSPEDPPDARKRAITDYLRMLVEETGRDWLHPGVRGAPGRGRFSVLDRLEPRQVPLFHEIAEDVHEVGQQLLAWAETLPTGGPPVESARRVTL